MTNSVKEETAGPDIDDSEFNLDSGPETDSKFNLDSEPQLESDYL